MKENSPDKPQLTMLNSSEELFNPSEPLYKLSNELTLGKLEKELTPLYAKKRTPVKADKIVGLFAVIKTNLKY